MEKFVIWDLKIDVYDKSLTANGRKLQEKGLQEEKEKWRSVPFGGSRGPPAENFLHF